VSLSLSLTGSRQWLGKHVPSQPIHAT
jgi:hypothetical protein